MLNPGITQSLGNVIHACQHIDGSSRGVRSNDTVTEVLSGCAGRGPDLRNLLDQMLNRLPDGCPRGGCRGAPRHGALDTGDVAGKHLGHYASPGGPSLAIIQPGPLARVGKSAISGCNLLIGILDAFL